MNGGEGKGGGEKRLEQERGDGGEERGVGDMEREVRGGEEGRGWCRGEERMTRIEDVVIVSVRTSEDAVVQTINTQRIPKRC